MGGMGDRRAGPVDVPPQAEDELDLADGLPGRLGNHFRRRPLVGQRPDRRVPLAQASSPATRAPPVPPPDSEPR